MAEMAMFPLGGVLLPGMVIPLHVFEPRYKEMMRRCLAGDREFGVALIERGSEVGGGDVRTDVGVVARIVQADRARDGRWGVMALGTRRIRIETWLDDDPYPRADVIDWPDVPSPDPTTLEARYNDRAVQLRRVMAMAAELGQPGRPWSDLDGDPTVGMWEMSMAGQFGPLDLYRLLGCDGPDRRLELLGELIDDLEMVVRARIAEG